MNDERGLLFSEWKNEMKILSAQQPIPICIRQYGYRSRKSQFSGSCQKTAEKFVTLIENKNTDLRSLISTQVDNMYIYPSSPESASSLQSEESAAVKIQAGFRGYRVRKHICCLTNTSNSTRTNSHIHISSKRYLSDLRKSFRRQQHSHARTHDLMEERQKCVKKAADGQQVPASKENESSMEDRCATKIQAGFRGFIVRKKQKLATDAAVKIQSSFRGFKARKEVEKIKHS